MYDNIVAKNTTLLFKQIEREKKLYQEIGDLKKKI